MLHGAGRRRAAGRVRDARRADGRARGHDVGGPRPRDTRTMDSRLHRNRREPVRLLHSRDHHAAVHASIATTRRRSDERCSRICAAAPAGGPSSRRQPKPQPHRSRRCPVTSRPRHAGRRSRAACTNGSARRWRAGGGRFADDHAPADSLVAAPLPDGTGWAIGATVREARAASGKRQGRRTTADLRWPIDVPAGDWALTLRTTWVEPAYLETDASWARPGEAAADPLANGGAFGGKSTTAVTRAAARPRGGTRSTRAGAVVA